MDARTGDQNAEPSTEDKIVGLGSTGAQVLLNQAGLNKIINPAKVTATGAKGALQAAGNVLKAAGTEGAVGAGQDLVSQGAAKVGTDQPIDWQEVKGSGAMSAANGGVFAAKRGATDAAVAARLRDIPVDEHTAMAANRLLRHVEDPNDLQDPHKAFQAVDAATQNVKDELTAASQRVSNPSREAANAISRAKSGEALTHDEQSAIDRENDPLLSSLARQNTALADLKEHGRFGEGRFAGGASEFVRAHAFGLGKLVGGVGALSHAAGQGAIGLDSLLAGLPNAAEAVAAGALGYKALQKIDKLTGAYTPAYNFAQKFGNGSRHDDGTIVALVDGLAEVLLDSLALLVNDHGAQPVLHVEVVAVRPFLPHVNSHGERLSVLSSPLAKLCPWVMLGPSCLYLPLPADDVLLLPPVGVQEAVSLQGADEALLRETTDSPEFFRDLDNSEPAMTTLFQILSVH